MDLNLLGLTKKEERALKALQKGLNTPLLLARETKISRTALYAILDNLKKRGLVKSKIVNGKKHWSLSETREIEEALYATKRVILKIPEGRQEVAGLSDSSIVVHRGKEAVRKVINFIFSEHKGERLYGFQGDVAAQNWSKIFSVDDINRFNRAIKKNGMILEAILPEGWFEHETKKLGVEWARDFEGRTMRANVIDEEYFAHGGQLFLFKNSIYLLALGEELIIEIRNSEIQKMLLAFFKFIQENSRVIDGNALLRELMEVKEN